MHSLSGGTLAEAALNHSSREEFLKYYADRSETAEEVRHCVALRSTILRVLKASSGEGRCYDVLDIGCAAGTQSTAWAELGHRVHGLDVNEPLLNLAKQRASSRGYEIDFRLGSAAHLPWPDQSMDVCLALELLEHVADWTTCLNECARVIRPGGVLYLSTNNKLCPKQSEFNLAFYSWYPATMKRHFERLAVTSRPDLANYAVYPAVNWFTPYSLAAELSARGFGSLDRFDLIDTSNKGKLAKLVVSAVHTVPLLRFAGFCCTPATTLLGIKQ